jgi:ankyrin repeat protein
MVLSRDIYSSILDEFKGADGEKVVESFGQTVKALMPENFFISNPAAADMAISQGQASLVLDFLKLAMYFLSNNFCSAEGGVSMKVYTWLERRSNTGLLEYLFSIGGPTIEALMENFFRLAIDADDVYMVKKMIDLGIDPNEQIYRACSGSIMTPLQRACKTQSLELVRVLIDGGARVDLPAESGAYSALTYAVDPRDENYELRDHVDIELVRILLHAGAAVNPGFGESPLADAANSGHVELVTLLIAEGADVHFSDEVNISTPLMKAVQCDLDIPDRDVISIVRTLLQAGADAQACVSHDDCFVTVLEAAIPRKSVELIQLLLDNGARVTQSAFITAVEYGDLNIAKLLFKPEAQVTEAAIESAIDNDGTELVIFLLETAEDKVKFFYKTIALINSIKHGKGDLMDWLDSSGAQLDINPRLTDAIEAAAQRRDM